MGKGTKLTGLGKVQNRHMSNELKLGWTENHKHRKETGNKSITGNQWESMGGIKVHSIRARVARKEEVTVLWGAVVNHG